MAIYIILTITLSFLCSIIEAVLLSINPTFIKIKLKEGKTYAKNLLELKNSIDEPMWSIICNKVNITSTALEGTRTSLKAKKTKVKQNEKDGTGSSSRQQKLKEKCFYKWTKSLYHISCLHLSKVFGQFLSL